MVTSLLPCRQTGGGSGASERIQLMEAAGDARAGHDCLTQAMVPVGHDCRAFKQAAALRQRLAASAD